MRQPDPAANRKAADALRAEGNILFGKQKYGAAIEKYTEAVVLAPDWPVLYVNRALAHKKKGDMARVAEDASRALELDRDLMKAHYLLGAACLEQGQLGRAARHLQKALEAARAADDSIKDDIWHELARAKYTAWQVRDAARREARVTMRATLQQLGKDPAYAAPPAQAGAPNGQQASAGSGQPGPTPMVVDDPGSPGDPGAAAGGAGQQQPGEAGVVYGVQDVRSAPPLALLQGLLAEAEARDAPREVPSTLTCPITMEVFRDPVITPAGHSYERAALLDHIKRVGPFDPIARTVKLDASQLVPNLGLRAAVQVYLDDHPHAWGECR